MNLQELAAAFDHLDLFATQVVEGFITGLHKSPFHGFSVEFAEHRLYNTGESTRNIDWKLYGRTDKLFVKRYDEETNLRCHILLDVSPSMYYPQDSEVKIRFAAVAAAVLANLMKRQRDAFALTRFADTIMGQTEVRSSQAHYRQVISELQQTLVSKPRTGLTHVAETLNMIASGIHRRSLVIILSDMFDSGENSDALFSALQHLRFRKHEVIVFQISDARTELDFQFENRPYRFTDPESGEELKLFPDDVRAYYLEKMRAYRKALKTKCEQFHIGFEEVDAAGDFRQILQAFFVKRSRML